MDVVIVLLILVGSVILVVSYFVPYPARRKNLLIPIQSLREIIFFTLPGIIAFIAAFLYTQSVLISLLIVIGLYVFSILTESSILARRIFPTPRRKWFYEILLPNLMKTSETYTIKIILKPANAELEYHGQRTERVLRHVALSFEEKPISESSKRGQRHLSGEISVGGKSQGEEMLLDAGGEPILISIDATSTLLVQASGPAFAINPTEQSVTLEYQPTYAEFLITPSKSGKHLLAIDFH